MFFGMDEDPAMFFGHFLSLGLSVFVVSVPESFTYIFKKFKQHKHLEENDVYAIIRLTANIIALLIKYSLIGVAFVIGAIIGGVVLLVIAFIMRAIFDFLS
jgi:hypothetical protein